MQGYPRRFTVALDLRKSLASAVITGDLNNVKFFQALAAIQMGFKFSQVFLTVLASP